jgi:hypothetical protein
VTGEFAGKLAEQTVGQLIPAGELVTVPVPAPAMVTVKATFATVLLKLAVTSAAAVSVTVHDVDPEQLPPHPVKEYPEAGASARATCAPGAKFAEHVPGQLMPTGLLITVPPTGAVTDNAYPVLKLALTFSAAVMVTLHEFDPEQLPAQPPKKYPDPGVSVRVTRVLAGKLAEHVPGQLTPTGELVTVPAPDGGGETVS